MLCLQMQVRRYTQALVIVAQPFVIMLRIIVYKTLAVVIIAQVTASRFFVCFSLAIVNHSVTVIKH
jgi:hypothetical protein